MREKINLLVLEHSDGILLAKSHYCVYGFPQILWCQWSYTKMMQWSEHLLSSKMARVRMPDLASYVGWVCWQLILVLATRNFLQVLQLFFLPPQVCLLCNCSVFSQALSSQEASLAFYYFGQIESPLSWKKMPPCSYLFLNHCILITLIQFRIPLDLPPNQGNPADKYHSH